MSERIPEHRAVLQSDTPPTEEQRRRLGAFIRRTYNQDIPLEWEEVPELGGGFRLYVDTDLYDWSVEGRMRQFYERMARIAPGPKNCCPSCGTPWRNSPPASCGRRGGRF